jgi:RND family efflux transporter MFP subunit
MTDASTLSRLKIDRDPPARSGGSRTPLLLLGLITAIVVSGWIVLRPRAIEVRTATAVATGGGSASSSGISASGYVVARTKASVSAKIPGQLVFLGVAEGSAVKRGQVLAQIENSDYQAALDAARASRGTFEAQLAQGRRDLERAEQLRSRDVNSPIDVESARTQVSVLEAQLASSRAQEKLAEVNLENTRVRAPFDGTVLRKDAEVGEIVAPSSAGGGLSRTAIVTMADLGTLEVEVDVNEAYIAQIRNGQSAVITLDAYPDTSFAGRVRQVVPTADRQKATVLVKVSILDRDPRILPEMGAKVVFSREEHGGAVASAPRRVLVPRGAVVQNGQIAKVWVLEDGAVRAVTVEPGPERGDQVEIRNGLTGGESLVLDPPGGLTDGQKVRIARS